MSTLLRLSPGAAVWRVAWPMIALGQVRALYLAVDAWWVGRLGSEALTALAAASFGWWIIDHVCELAGTGTHARVAQAEGGGAREGVADLLGRGLLVAGLCWVGLAVVTPWVAAPYADALGLAADGAVRQLTRDYLVATAWGALGVAVQATVGAVFRGLGETRTALALTTLGLVVNAGLDPVLIWGWGPIPALGLAGAAWATGIGAGVAGALGVATLALRGLGPRGARFDADTLDIARLGLPIAVLGVGFSLVYVVLGRLVTGFGEAEVAALGVGHRLESFPYLAGVGFLVGASTMVGQHVGAGDAARAHEAARSAARWCAAVMLVSALPALALAEPLYGLFTSDPAIVAAGGVYLRFQAVVWVFMGLELVYEGAFTGAGRTDAPLAIGGSLTLARLPVAALLMALGAGVEAVWAAIALSTAAKGVVLAWRFHALGDSVIARRRVALVPATAAPAQS